MSQVMQCPLCNGEMTITPELEGRDVRCPHCQQEIHIPGGAAAAPSAPPGTPGAPGAPGYPGYTQQSYREVPNYLVQAILVTLCCCWPFGIPAIVYAAIANSKKGSGDYAAALKAANTAKTWCWVAFLCGLAIGLFYAIMFAAGASSGGPGY
jgi:hypothetical protein